MVLHSSLTFHILIGTVTHTDEQQVQKRQRKPSRKVADVQQGLSNNSSIELEPINKLIVKFNVHVEVNLLSYIVAINNNLSVS